MSTPTNPNDRTYGGNVRSLLPEITGRLKPPHDQQMPSTLAQRLTPVVDQIRTIYANFGTRPYRVYLIHALWPSGTKGSGVYTIISCRELVPVPRVRDMGQISENLRATGMTEEGGIIVDQISTRYTEDDLMGKTPDLQDPALMRTSKENVEFFIEVREARPSTPTSIIRRFVPVSAPMLSRDTFQWTIGLIRQDYDRSRSGETVPRSAF